MILSELFSWNTLNSALDVVLVASLIYYILRSVQGTRALPMIGGLGILVSVYLASSYLGLVTLTWVLGKFLEPVILVIVILFQDDIRRALVKVGLIPGLGGASPQNVETTLTEISRAASELSAKRCGGLIVLGRDVGLEEYTENAIEIGAKVSSELLITIFQTSSPLHDGAVIIEGEKIIAAGAVLPLSFNPVAKSLGTRHRAAVGLSERTDAVVVVVSEETGIISLVREGRMTRDLNERGLHSSLQRLTLLRARRGRRRFPLLWSRRKSTKEEGRVEQSDVGTE